MYPALRMLHSTLIQSHHEACLKLHLDQYADSYCSVHLMTVTPQKMPLQLLDQLQQVCLEEEEEEEDFQTVPLDNEHWTTEELPDRTLCIHEHALPHGLCPYLCPYANFLIPSYADSLDLSDISDFEDIMITSSNEDIPALEDTLY